MHGRHAVAAPGARRAAGKGPAVVAAARAWAQPGGLRDPGSRRTNGTRPNAPQRFREGYQGEETSDDWNDERRPSPGHNV